MAAPMPEPSASSVSSASSGETSSGEYGAPPTVPSQLTAPPPPVTPPRPTWEPRRAESSRPWLRPTIRIRLTVLYGGMFLIAGVLLLLVIYLLAADAMR